MPKQMHLIIRGEGRQNYISMLCDSITVGSRNVVIDDGRIVIPHEQHAILISWKEVDDENTD